MRLTADRTQCGPSDSGMVRQGQRRYAAIFIAPLHRDVLTFPHQFEPKRPKRLQNTADWSINREFGHGSSDDGFGDERLEHDPVVAIQNIRSE